MTTSDRRLLNSHEMAALLGISEQTVRKHTRQGRYPFARNLGSEKVPRWRYDRRALDRWLESRAA